MKPAAGIVVVGASTGGPSALRELLPGLPADFPLPVVIAQHLHDEFTGILLQTLRPCSHLRVDEASSGGLLVPGTVLLAAGQDVRITDQYRVDVSPATFDDGCCSVDVLFESASATFGPRVLAVVLSGMGDDGLRGAAVIRANGGRVLAQSDESSAVWGMPGAVARAGLSSYVSSPSGLAAILVELAS
jgi:two-component system chemotaxis response regulator CheB